MKKAIALLMVLALTAILLSASVAADETEGTYQITSPDEGEFVFGGTTFEATYYGKDTGRVHWAVREGTCDPVAEKNVMGNVTGVDDEYDWDYDSDTNTTNFFAEADTVGWDPGWYCFVLNPENGGRYTRRFWVVEEYVSGGGQLVEEVEGAKRKDWHVVSFGGAVANAGDDGLIGDMQINFHNVGNDDLDKARFHTTDITKMKFFTRDCGIAMNFTADGLLNGEEGYSMIFRAQDAGEPGELDNVRVELKKDGTVVYDTLDDFTKESDCVGTARTMLDSGNLQMDTQ